MSLRLVNKDRTYPVQVCDTTINIVSLSVREKEELVHKLGNIGIVSADDTSLAFDRLLDIIAPVITKIGDYSDETRVILGRIEEIGQLREIVAAVINHCRLTDTERKN